MNEINAIASYQQTNTSGESIVSRNRFRSPDINISDISQDTINLILAQPSEGNRALSSLEGELKAQILELIQSAVNSVVERLTSAETNKPEEKPMLAFKEKVESLLTPNTDGTVSEDELRYGIISYQLYQKSPAIEAKFQELYRAARSKGTNKDAASEQALCELVTANKLTSSEADWVASLSFRAAQLDGSQQHLASGLGGGSLNLPAALQIAEASLAGIQSGTIKVPPRTLSSADATNTSLSTDPGADMRANAQFIEGTARNGFLWKPISESDGNLVVLLPSSLSGRISSVSVYESGTLTSDNAIEKGRFVGDTNGDRPTFRFGDPGAEYPENATVLVETKNGEFLRFDIENSAVRNN